MTTDNAPLVGTWRLLSAVMQDVDTNENIPAWGDEPNGCLVLTSGGRWIVVQTAQGRKTPRRCAALLCSYDLGLIGPTRAATHPPIQPPGS
jgi:Lipocalin-like domain